MNKDFKSRLITTLKEVGTNVCIDSALKLEKDDSNILKLELRNADLDENHLKKIGDTLTSFENEEYSFKTLSFSYNHIGDKGAEYLSKSMPLELVELGLVGCSITDAGGRELLKWLNKTKNLKLLCIENNKFSKNFLSELSTFLKSKTNLCLVI
jgi:hypothetical protein